MKLSDENKIYLSFLKDIFEVSEACSTKTFIWGGTTIDILEGRFLREHHDIDAFTLNLLEIREQMAKQFALRGYELDYLAEVDMLKISKAGKYAAFNRLEVDQDIALWRTAGDEGTVYFPWQWLDQSPRDFYGVKVYISGVRFEYAIKTNPKLLHPEWEPRKKDREAIDYLNTYLERQGINRATFLSKIWSYNPYWRKRGYSEYSMPFVAWPIKPH